MALDPTVVGVLLAMELLKVARQKLAESAPTEATTPEVVAAYHELKARLDVEGADLEARVKRNLERAGLA